jgi:hypothetical protein
MSFPPVNRFVVVVFFVAFTALHINAQSTTTLKIESIMSPEEQLATGVRKLTLSERAALERWIESWSLKAMSLAGGEVYPGVGSGHFIMNNCDGEVIKLEDGSIWIVSPLDLPYSILWLPTVSITIIDKQGDIYPYVLVNTDDHETAAARFVGIE